MASHTPPLRYCMAFGSLVEMLSGVNGARSGIEVESSAPWGLWGGGGLMSAAAFGRGSALPETGRLLYYCLCVPSTRSHRCPLSFLATNSPVRPHT